MVQGGSCPKDVPDAIKKGLTPALDSLAPGQCVLLADTGVFHLASHVHNLWLDGLYIRLVSFSDDASSAGSTQNDAPRALAVSSQGSMVFVTDVTIQGNGSTAKNKNAGHQAVALWAGSSSIHIQGAHSCPPVATGPFNLNSYIEVNIHVPTWYIRNAEHILFMCA